jgi:acyl-CoA synthetase (NDP forming)
VPHSITAEPSAADSVVTVGALLAARNIALIGASDRVAWSQGLHRNLRASPGLGRLWLVNPASGMAHGEATVPSLDAIDEDIDLACVVVGAGRVLEVLRSVTARGIPAAIVIASGFAEAGDEGARRSAAVRDLARSQGLTVLGPNTAGMVNVAGGIWPLATTMSPPAGAGPLVIAAQSGGVASQLLRLSQARGVGANAVYGVGNELVVSAIDVVRHYLHDDQTRVIALYLEGIRDPQAFTDVAVEAARAGKPLVVMKVGRSARGGEMVMSHTGAMVGDDQVVDVALRQLGVIRVETLEDLVTTAGLLAHGPALPGLARHGLAKAGTAPRGRGIAVVSGSGAGCTMAADRAAAIGLELAEFAPATIGALAALLPPGTEVHNPLDATGAVLGDLQLSARAVTVLASDPNVGAVLCQSLISERFGAGLEPLMAERARATAEAVAGSAVPVVLETDIATDVSPELRRVLTGAGLYVSRGIDQTISAMSAASWWAETAPGVRSPARPGAAAPGPGQVRAVPMTQMESLDLLARSGVPVLPTVLAADAAAAVAAARSLGYPVVAKLEADGVTHKSDLGGVELGLADDGQVRAAYERIVTAAAASVGREMIRGVLVTPMRQGETELVVSVSDAAPWGTMLTVGLGGIWVELLNDVAHRLLPVTDADVLAMLAELRGQSLLTGGRGRRPANLDQVVQAIIAVTAAAADLGPRLHSIEINPLLAGHEEATVLDALVLVYDA